MGGREKVPRKETNVNYLFPVRWPGLQAAATSAAEKIMALPSTGARPATFSTQPLGNADEDLLRCRLEASRSPGAGGITSS
jgi:hypothetical protein